MASQRGDKIKKMLMISISLILLSYIFATIVSWFSGMQDGNVALISIKGPIVTHDSTLSDMTSADDIIGYLEDAEERPEVKALLIEINSPGGSAVASDEIATKLKGINMTKVAVIREIGTSGAYWIATAADTIVANRMSVTGSIGATSSYLEIGGLLNKYNITYQRLVSAEYKDIGSPFRDLEEDEKKILEDMLERIHGFFVEAVAENRNMTLEDVEELSDGMFYLGVEAQELGLIDKLGTKEDAIQMIEKEIGEEASIYEYRRDRSILDIIAEIRSSMTQNIGIGQRARITT